MPVISGMSMFENGHVGPDCVPGGEVFPAVGGLVDLVAQMRKWPAMSRSMFGSSSVRESWTALAVFAGSGGVQGKVLHSTAHQRYVEMADYATA